MARPTCFKGALKDAIPVLKQERHRAASVQHLLSGLMELVMDDGALRTSRTAPHVIVIGNGKGGTGKTTLAMHLAIGLLQAGQKVGTLDLDPDQQCMTCYVDHRRVWANRSRSDLLMPLHGHIPAVAGMRVDETEAEELACLEAAIRSAAACDFLVIDTPSQDTYLARVAHLIADSILTPLQDSLLDLCSLGTFDPITHEMVRAGPYAHHVCKARKARHVFDPGFSDWVVIHERSGGPSLVDSNLDAISSQFGFRHIEGLSERRIYRQLFAYGLTAFDPLPESAASLEFARFEAQNEIDILIRKLDLPLSERGLRRAAARSEWFRRKDLALDIEDVLAAE